MKFSLYMKSAIWELILLALLALAMTYQILNCFYVAPSIQYGPIPGVVAVAAIVALTLVNYTRRTRLIGGAVYGVVCVIAIIACGAMTGEGVFVDNEQNYLILSMVILITPTVIFLLGRTRTGSAFAFIICAFLSAAIQFFYMKYELLWLIVTLLSAVALLIYKNYQLSARTATTVRKLSFVPGFATACAAVALSVGLGCGIWFLVIAPLDPGAVDIKLITEYRAQDTEIAKGVSDVYMTPNFDLTSSETSNDVRTTDQLVETDTGIDTPANGNEQTETEQQVASGSFLGIDFDSLQQQFAFLTYDVVSKFMLGVLALLLLIIVGYFVERRLHRNRRLKRYQALEPRQQATAIYCFLADNFGRLGMGVPDGQTTLEYAAGVNESMRYFNAAAGVDFKEIAGLYSAVAYGDREIGDDDLNLFARYYKAFWKGARKHLGNVKYFLKSFKLG